MGQYLAIGIDHKYVVSQDSAEKVGKTLDEIVGVLQKQYAPEDLYDLCVEDSKYGKYAIFTLKSEVIEKELVPFTTDFYDLYYGGTDEKLYERLKNVRTYENLIELAGDKMYERFQNDEYGEPDWFGIKEVRRSLRINHESIILCLEGKIIMEEYGRIFWLLSDLLAEKFSKYKLAKTFNVYITG